jgi:hypothetical protein
MSGNKKLIFSVVGLVLVAAYAAISVLSHTADEIKLPLPATLTNLAEIKAVEIRDAAGQVVLSGAFGVASSKNNSIERKANLTATGVDADATGKAEVEISSKNNVNEQELEVEVKRLTAAAEYKVFVDGQEVATFTANPEGEAELEISNDPVK